MEQHEEHTAFPDTTARYGLRVYTLGTFGIEWVDPQTGQSISFPPERFQGSRVASCWALFKALLVCPDRFAPRSWLLEQFWPASKSSSATERLNDVASALRILLRPKESKTSLVHFVYGTEKGGAGYRLEGYPQIWCDADAFEWYVKHGMLLDQRGLDSRACWERASALAERGAYLPEHVYEEWAKGRREQLDGLLRDCVQRWTQILRQAGHVDEAILRLRGYWLEHPTDEDALRPLLELLGERERFQEAEQCYAKFQTALAGDGLEPHERTKEALEVVRALRIRRNPSNPLVKPTEAQKPSVQIGQEQALFDEQNSFALERIASVPTLALEVASEASVEAVGWTTWLAFKQGQIFTNILQGQGLPDETLRKSLVDDFVQLQQSVTGYPAEASNQLLLSVATLPLAQLRQVQQEYNSTHLLVEDFLRCCVASFVACHHLLRKGHLFQVEYILTCTLPMLTTLSQHRSPSQKRAASLASQGYRLANILALHQDNLGLKEHYCKQALQQSLIAEDPSLSVAALKGLAVTCYYQGAPLEALQAYQQASQSDTSSALLRSCIHIGSAQAYAQCGEEQQALDAIELAFHTFPDHPESDSSFLYADFDHTQLTLWEGLTYLSLGQHHLAQNEPQQSQAYRQKAWETFACIEKRKEPITETARDRTDILNHMAVTALVLGDPQRFCIYLEKGMKETVALGSKKRKRELIATYTQGRRNWPQDTTLQEVGDALLTAFLAEDHPTR